MLRKSFVTLLLAGLLAACASPSYVVLLPDLDGGTGQVEGAVGGGHTSPSGR